MQNANQLHQVINNMQAQLNDLQQRNEQMQRDMQAAPKTLELRDEVRDAIPAHLQLQPLDAAQRKRILNRYPKSDQLPRAITDDNGLASKAISDPIGRRAVTQDSPQLQRDALDVLRMAATAWHQAPQHDNDQRRAEFLTEVIRDIAIIACDNAQKMADKQLKQAFEHAKAKGAQAILDLADNSSSIDFNDHNVFQHAHVEAIQQIRKYSAAVEQKRGNGRNGNSNNNRNRYNRGGNGRNFTRSDFGRNRGGRGGFGFQGNGGRSGAWPRSNYNNSNSGANSQSNHMRD